MKRSTPTSSTTKSDADANSTWQACQARFRKSRKTSLLDDVHIQQSVAEHMQLAPPAMEPLDKEIFAFLPLRESMDDSSSSSYPDDDLTLTPTSPTALPLVPLRRDHSVGGGRRLPMHSKRSTLNTLSDL